MKAASQACGHPTWHLQEGLSMILLSGDSTLCGDVPVVRILDCSLGDWNIAYRLYNIVIILNFLGVIIILL